MNCVISFPAAGMILHSQPAIALFGISFVDSGIRFSFWSCWRRSYRNL